MNAIPAAIRTALWPWAQRSRTVFGGGATVISRGTESVVHMVEIRRENCGEVALTCFSSFDTGFGSNPKARYESLVGRLGQILLQRPKLWTARIEFNRPLNRPPGGRALAGLQLGLSEQKMKLGIVRRML
jgi:hypothetical protein